MIDNLSPITRCLANAYGIGGDLMRLPGENINYLVTTKAGDRYILKIVDQDMPSDAVEMEDAVIKHALLSGFEYQLPEIIKNRKGEIETGIKLHENGYFRSRLLAFVEGIQLDSLSDISKELRFELGRMLARFDLAVADFKHPSSHRKHRWNLAEADQHLGKIRLFEDREKQRLVRWAFDLWEADAKAILPELPHQVIHGDAHGENVLIDGESITGLVDFGDCCFNPVICELGVCLPYMMMEQDDPLEFATDIVAGYCSEKTLSKLELSVLFPLICARLAVTLCVAEERRMIDPNHPNWFGDAHKAESLLNQLSELADCAGKVFIL